VKPTTSPLATTAPSAAVASLATATRSRWQPVRELLARAASGAHVALGAARREIARAPRTAAKAWRLRRADSALRSAVMHRDLPESIDAALAALKNGADPLMLWGSGIPDAPESVFVAAALWLGARHSAREHELEAALRAAAVVSPLLKSRGRLVAAQLMKDATAVGARFDLQNAAALVRAGCGLTASSGDAIEELLDLLASRAYFAHYSPMSYGEPDHAYDAMAAVLDDQGAQQLLRAENAYAARRLVARLLPSPEDHTSKLCAWAGGQRPHRSRAYCWLADQLITRFLPLLDAREMIALAVTGARGDEPGSPSAGTPVLNDPQRMLPMTWARIERADLSAAIRLAPIPERADQGPSAARENQSISPASPARQSRARRL